MTDWENGPSLSKRRDFMSLTVMRQGRIRLIFQVPVVPSTASESGSTGGTSTS